MLIDYQALVRNCVRDLKIFKINARDALENHVLAVELFNADEYSEAILALSECKVSFIFYDFFSRLKYLLQYVGGPARFFLGILQKKFFA